MLEQALAEGRSSCFTGKLGHLLVSHNSCLSHSSLVQATSNYKKHNLVSESSTVYQCGKGFPRSATQEIKSFFASEYVFFPETLLRCEYQTEFSGRKEDLFLLNSLETMSRLCPTNYEIFDQNTLQWPFFSMQMPHLLSMIATTAQVRTLGIYLSLQISLNF